MLLSTVCILIKLFLSICCFPFFMLYRNDYIMKKDTIFDTETDTKTDTNLNFEHKYTDMERKMKKMETI